MIPTTALSPMIVMVTRTTDPSGSVRCAAVKAPSFSPLTAGRGGKGEPIASTIVAGQARHGVRSAGQEHAVVAPTRFCHQLAIFIHKSRLTRTFQDDDHFLLLRPGRRGEKQRETEHERNPTHYLGPGPAGGSANFSDFPGPFGPRSLGHWYSHVRVARSLESGRM